MPYDLDSDGERRMKIVPMQGVGEFSFGDNYSVIKGKLDSTFESFKLVLWNKYNSDISDSLGIVLSYDDEGNLETVVINKPQNVEIFGTTLCNVGVKQFISIVKKEGYTFIKDKTDGGCYFNDDLGMNFTYKGDKIDTIEVYAGMYMDMREKQRIKMKKFYEEQGIV